MSVASINSTRFTPDAPPTSVSTRDLAELILGFTAILVILWLPTRQQMIFGPIALLAPLALVLCRRPSLHDLGLSSRGLVLSLWMLPAACALAIVGITLAKATGTFHPLFNADLAHVGGYVLWTIYQQFLLQDYFMPRLTRLLNTGTAIAAAALLFALAHLPNLPLAIATLAWGAVSCALFRRFRSLLILGLVQGLLGLSFAVCIPDTMLHHMRVGLGYSRYQPIHAALPDPANSGE